ncbi:MAG TPA: DegV family protein [Bacillota bacterium]|nr:DegV family protein [Bacillota bacterium]
MSGISIMTDSTADLSRELIARYGVTVVPLAVVFGQDAYKDGVDIDTQRLFELVEQNKQLPKTSSPSPEVFRSVFEEAVAHGHQVLYIGISSKFSASVQNAALVAGAFPEGQVRVFDSANLSTGIAHLVLYARDLVSQGRQMDEILAALERARPKVRTSFKLDRLDYMHMGGRCTGVQTLLSSVLKIRPVISVADGGMIVAGKVRGSSRKSLDWMMDRFEEDVRQGLVREDRVFLTHTGVHEDAVYMAERVREIMPEMKEILETPAGSVIGSHCGPGTIGILYILD